MTVRGTMPSSLAAGLLAPLKYDEIRFDYSSTEIGDLVVNIGYYANGIFLSRVETTYDSQGRESTIIAYSSVGPF